MTRARLTILGAIVLVLLAIWWLWPRSIGPEETRSGWLGTLGWDTPRDVTTGTPPPPLPRHSAVPGEIAATPVQGTAMAVGSTEHSGHLEVAIPSGSAAPGATPAPATMARGPMGTVRVHVRVRGTLPPPKRIPVEADAFCARTPRTEEDVLAQDGNLQNAIVRVVKGADGTYAAPTTPAIIEQEHCMYRPRVQAVVAGQDITIKSMDDTTHNVHTYLGDDSLFNRAENKGEFTKKASDFRTSNGIVTFKCDIHPWMTGYVLISPNPYFAVTGEDGVATLSLPAGKYTLEVWQEKFGTHDVDVAVAPGELSETTVEYDPSRAKPGE